MNGDKSRAIPFLEPLALDPDNNPGIYYYLAKAYTYANKFDQALKYFNMAKEKATTPDADLKTIEREIEMCNNAKDLMSKAIDVNFENLGTKINTPYADYSPFISYDESFLIYNSRQEGNGVKKANGEFTSDVYISEVYMGDWQQGTNVGEVINTKAGDEQIMGVCADGLTLIFNYNQTGGQGLGDVFVGPKFQNQILKPFKVNENINSKFFENSATISPDGKTLYFSSDRPGGFGGFDLYRSLILPNGEWSEALNLGPDINTAYDEDFPFLSMDGNVLYFASKGHNSMGGFDVFKSDFSEEKNQWGMPLNLGFPVNNAYDNNGICMSGKGRYGYVSAIRPEGKGDLDIYRVTFNSIDAELTVVKGVIGSNDGGNKLLNPTLTVLNASTNKVVGDYIPNPITNKYVVILPPGEYFLKVKCGGFQDYKEKISIMGKGSFVPSMEKNVTMLPRK
jgi:tetratricopeptide (TPR) repeat protein